MVLQVVVRESERRSQAAMREWEHASLTDLVLLPLLPYLVWAFIYYGKARARQAPSAHLCAYLENMLLPAAHCQWKDCAAACAQLSMPLAASQAGLQLVGYCTVVLCFRRCCCRSDRPGMAMCEAHQCATYAP